MRFTLALMVAAATALAAPPALAGTGAGTAGVHVALGDEVDDCAMMMTWSALLVDGFVGAPTPEAALQKFLGWPVEARHFEPPPGQPRLVRRGASSVVYEWLNADDEVVATVGMNTGGSGWAVNGGSACVPG